MLLTFIFGLFACTIYFYFRPVRLHYLTSFSTSSLALLVFIFGPFALAIYFQSWPFCLRYLFPFSANFLALFIVFFGQSDCAAYFHLRLIRLRYLCSVSANSLALLIFIFGQFAYASCFRFGLFAGTIKRYLLSFSANPLALLWNSSLARFISFSANSLPLFIFGFGQSARSIHFRFYQHDTSPCCIFSHHARTFVSGSFLFPLTTLQSLIHHGRTVFEFISIVDSATEPFSNLFARACAL